MVVFINFFGKTTAQGEGEWYINLHRNHPIGYFAKYSFWASYINKYEINYIVGYTINGIKVSLYSFIAL